MLLAETMWDIHVIALTLGMKEQPLPEPPKVPDEGWEAARDFWRAEPAPKVEE